MTENEGIIGRYYEKVNIKARIKNVNCIKKILQVDSKLNL